MIDGCCSLVLWGICIPLRLFVFIMFLELTVLDGCLVVMGEVHTAAVNGPEDELCGAAVVLLRVTLGSGVE